MHLFTFCDFCTSEQCSTNKLLQALKIFQALIKNGIRVSASQRKITRAKKQLLCKHKPAFSAYSSINEIEKNPYIAVIEDNHALWLLADGR